MIQLEVLVEMMSIGTLLAYTLVSACVLILRYQPTSTNLIELLPQSLRTPVEPEGTASGQRETSFASTSQGMTSQHVMVRRVTRSSSPDSDDSMDSHAEDESDGRDDTFLVNSNNENKFYGAVPGGTSGNTTRCGRFFGAIYRQLYAMSYLCPGFFPWVDNGPATSQSGMFVLKSFATMFVMIMLFDVLAAYCSPGSSTFVTVLMVILLIGIIMLLLMISRKPQNRVGLIYAAPGLPFVPATAILVNIYLILNLSMLTLARFTVWMALGMVMYFKYGIKNSTLETNPPVVTAPTPPPPNPLDRVTIPPPSPNPRPTGDRNIFEGDGNNGYFGGHDQYSDPLLAWHDTDLRAVPTTSRGVASASTYRQVETRYDVRTNSTSSHTAPLAAAHIAPHVAPPRPAHRPSWAFPENPWDD
ncbi:probable cationic amino acid transporter [Ostrinia furnacalis]|uniref:probable cationic amino acid transporter n=1 Tax=Ostrinia furnacalis TaxID=93504 RepID=UPI00103BDFA3|nr:probable cationic amino acid transporter [Ostrinia furnacalis]